MLGADKALVLDDGRMRDVLEHLDLVGELEDLVLGLALEPDALDGDDAARVHVQRAVDAAELAPADALAEELPIISEAQTTCGRT